MKEFRTLYASEIEARVGTCSEKGVSLLLYKDARVDMTLLDETVGPMNWMRQHCRDNANCIISIWDEDKKLWVSKEDTGTESNTEAEKGLASDSFKRAGVNWGIGRELYTAPFIWVGEGENCKITPKSNGRGFDCREKFEVAHIAYNDRREISELQIINAKNKNVVFSMGGKGANAPKSAPKKKNETATAAPSAPHAPAAPEELQFRCECCGAIFKPYIGSDSKEVSVRKHAQGSIAKFGGHLYCIDCIMSGRVREAP